MPLPDLIEAAADAFTEGWKLSGCDAPFGEAEFRAAIGSALDCAHDPGVLEATLDLGHLTGTWKTVYSRRERLLRKHLKAVLAAWKACLAELDPRDMVRQFRQVMNLAAETAVKDPQKAWWKDAATTAAIAWLRGLYRTEGYPALVAAVEDAIRSGMAEGEAGALALAASRQGKTGFSIAKAFTVAYDRLEGDGDVSRKAADALAAIVAGAASSAGRALAGQAEDGGTEDEMTDAVDDTLSGKQPPAVELGTDWALSAAILAGAVALWQQAAGTSSGAGAGSAVPPPGGVPPDTPVLMDWVTAGDGRVCPICQDYEDRGPYKPEDVPGYPHPRCRCSVDLAASSGSSSFLAALLDSFAN